MTGMWMSQSPSNCLSVSGSREREYISACTVQLLICGCDIKTLLLFYTVHRTLTYVVTVDDNSQGVTYIDYINICTTVKEVFRLTLVKVAILHCKNTE